MEPTPIPIDDANSLLAGMPTPESVHRLEDALSQLPQVDLQTQMLVHGGMSARTVFIPAGTVVTGALTNLDNVCVVVGDITATTDTGLRRLTGVNVIPASAGFKRAVVAHDDTWWITLHRTDLTDPQAIEDEMTGEADRLQTRTLSLSAGDHPAIEGGSA